LFLFFYKDKMNNKKSKEIDRLVRCAMCIIEQVIEPLHYPKRGVAGKKYYQLEDSIIEILKAYKIK
jgi:hypothetical protein